MLAHWSIKPSYQGQFSSIGKNLPVPLNPVSSRMCRSSASLPPLPLVTQPHLDLVVGHVEPSHDHDDNGAIGAEQAIARSLSISSVTSSASLRGARHDYVIIHLSDDKFNLVEVA